VIPTLGIVVVNYNGLADTRRCLISLASLTKTKSFVVVVDNASSDASASILAGEFPSAAVIRSPINGGWAGGNNVGIRAALSAGADFVLLLNNDTVVGRDLGTRLLDAATAYPEYGILGPVIRDLDSPHDIQTEGCAFNVPGLPGFFNRVRVPLAPDGEIAVTEVDIVNGCCMMVSAAAFRKVGLIDERFFLIHEESDFCLRARRAGFRCGVIHEALVWHKGSQTFARSGFRVQRYYDTRNLALLLLKQRASLNRRGLVRSWFEFVRYAYYRYDIELENGCVDAAEAVLEGVCDAISRRFGAYRRDPRLVLPLVRRAFDTVRRLKGRS
jgi:hypothetical protein